MVVKQYCKLVRDRIPEIIKADGKRCTFSVLSEDDYISYLDVKLNEELIEYQYKLEGLDNKWRTATQQMLDKIIYYDLKPGKYMLAVRAKNYSSEWKDGC